MSETEFLFVFKFGLFQLASTVYRRKKERGKKLQTKGTDMAKSVLT